MRPATQPETPADEAYDTGNPEHVAARKKRAAARESLRLEGFRALCASRHGRAFLWDLMSRTGMFRTSFHPNSQTTAFNEGQRNVGLMLMADLNKHVPEMYPVMMKENGDDNG